MDDGRVTGFVFTLSGRPARLYQLQRSVTLADDWQTVDEAGPLTAESELVLSDHLPPAERGFYRLRIMFP